MFYDGPTSSGPSRGTIDLSGATISTTFREEEDKCYKGFTKVMLSITLGKSITVLRASSEAELTQWKRILTTRTIQTKESESFREGVLAIRNKNKKWKDRYCVLSLSGRLSYYKNKQAKKPSGE